LLQPLITFCSLRSPHTYTQLAYGATGAYGKKTCIWHTAYVQNLTCSRKHTTEIDTWVVCTPGHEILTRALSIILHRAVSNRVLEKHSQNLWEFMILCKYCCLICAAILS